MLKDLRTLKDTPPWDWPDETGSALLNALRDESTTEAELILACELAGDYTVVNDALAAALLSVVQRDDKSETIRGKAAISLGPVLEQAETDGFDDVDDLPITEHTFRRIQESLRQLYLDASVPGNVRRRILEASVRAPQEWHRDAVLAAFSSDDDAWKLTAVFSMRFVAGFEQEILQSLDSANPEIEYEAVAAAGNWEMDRAWSHVVALVTSEETDKALLLVAIEAVANIRPDQAAEILDDLADADDDEIAGAVQVALAMATGASGEYDEADDEDERLH
jgi:hypothetical protein